MKPFLAWFFISEPPSPTSVPAASLKSLPFKATSICWPFFFLMWNTRMNTWGINHRCHSEVTTIPIPTYLLEQSNDGEEGGGKPLCMWTRGPREGLCGSLLDRHPQWICANMSRHSRKCSGPDRTIVTATIQEGTLNASTTYFNSEHCAPC